MTLVALAAAASLSLGVAALHRVARLRARLRRVESSMHASLRSLGALSHAIIETEARSMLGEASPVLPLECHAPEGEDLVLWALFKGRSRGTFIEAGAFDGRRHSVSHIFEAVGWSGLLVEPLPGKSQACVRYRRGSKVVQAALVGSSEQARVTLEVVPDRTDEEGTTSGLAGALRRSDRRVERVEVPGVTLDSALQGIEPPIDWVVLDVEGGEVDALRGFDLDRFKPRVLVVEEVSYRREDLTRKRAIREHLWERGYQAVASVGHNGWFVRREDDETAQRLSALLGVAR